MFEKVFFAALRNLRNRLLDSFITIGGLAVGLAACLLIFLFVRAELSYEDWLPNNERIANLQTTIRLLGREGAVTVSAAPAPAMAALARDFSSDIEAATRLVRKSATIRTENNSFSDHISYVDPAFFAVFDLPMVTGQRAPALMGSASVLVSEAAARKYFAGETAVGKLITINNQHDVRVAGVFQDLPQNSHLKLELIAGLDERRLFKGPAQWGETNTLVYALFRSSSAIAQVQSELTAFADRNVVLDFAGAVTSKPSDTISFNLMPVRDIYLYTQNRQGVEAVVTFVVLGLLVLLIACANFVNLATAGAMTRAREVALRKVLGATRWQIAVQFLGEAVLIALFALVVAVALVELALPAYSQLLNQEFALKFESDAGLWWLALSLVAVVGLAGGAYPAVYLSRFRPALVLKANQSTASGGGRIRSGLVIFQFAISAGLMIATATLYSHAKYARSLDLGYSTSNKLVLSGLRQLPGDGEMARAIRREVAALPWVKGASLVWDAPPMRSNWSVVLQNSSTPNDEPFMIEQMRVDADFFSVYEVKPLAGRIFSPDRVGDLRSIPSDSSQEATQALVVNETFVNKLGHKNAQDAIGATYWEPVEEPESTLIRSTVVGVVGDMHVRSARTVIAPMLYRLDNEFVDQLTVAIQPTEVPRAVTAIEAIWARLAPGFPLRSAFIDHEVAALYNTVDRRAQLFSFFSLVAILIACVGLFGLSSFATQRRFKEIGIRKAFGASVLDIVRLLVWQFTKPVILGNLIAWPLAFYALWRWLGSFAYHLELAEPVFLFSVFGGTALLTGLIAWGTVAIQAMRVSRSKPIHALRDE